jgi:hypothetical protein
MNTAPDHAQDADPALTGLLYRFGFICYPTTSLLAGDATWELLLRTWRELRVEGLRFRVHPETRVMQHANGQGTAVLLGDMFSDAPGGPEEQILAQLLEAENPDFFDRFDHLSGRFALFMFKGSTRRVFHDPVGSRSVFYRQGDTVCVASHAELIAHAFQDPRRGDVERLLETPEYSKRLVQYLPGDWSLYQGIYALVPNNYLDLRAGCLVRYWPRNARSEATLDQFFDIADSYLQAFADFLRPRYRLVVGISGGIDCRGLIAAFRRHELAFDGVTWSYPFLRQVEKPIVTRIVELLYGEHTYLRVFSPPETHPLGKIAASNYGGISGLRRETRVNVPMSTLSNQGAAFVYGLGAEILRGFMDRPAETGGRIGPTHLARHYGMGDGKSFYAEQSVSGARGFLERANYDGAHLSGFRPKDLYYWEHRLGMWGSARLNSIDVAIYGLIGYNSRPLFQTAFGLPPEIRLSKQLIARLVERYDPLLGKIPFV